MFFCSMPELKLDITALGFLIYHSSIFIISNILKSTLKVISQHTLDQSTFFTLMI